ncbi:MAG: hypothetical protein RLZZ511_4178 [Cyanobacteriota bacterium]|jgi:hypothetical protein
MLTKPVLFIGWLIIIPTIGAALTSGAVQKSGADWKIRPAVIQQSVGETVDAMSKPYEKLARPAAK